MTKDKIKTGNDRKKHTKLPSLDPEAREKECIGYAMELAAEKLRNGTASSQLITHFLRLGSEKEKLEREILEKQKVLMEAKTEALQSQKNAEELYAKAIDAIKLYSKSSDLDD